MPDAAMLTMTGDAKPLRCEGRATAAGYVINQCEGREKINKDVLYMGEEFEWARSRSTRLTCLMNLVL